MTADSYFEKDLFVVLDAFDGGEDSLNNLYDLVHHRVSKSRIVYELVKEYGRVQVEGVLVD